MMPLFELYVTELDNVGGKKTQQLVVDLKIKKEKSLGKSIIIISSASDRKLKAVVE